MILYLFSFFLFLVFPSTIAAQVVINEFLPNPANEDDEWIELFNSNSSQTDLSDWILDDEPNAGSKPYLIPSGKTVPPNSLLRFPKAETGIILNNSKQKDQSYADMVRLLNKDGQEIDSITYTSTSTDKPISRHLPTLTPHPTSKPLPPTSTPSPLPKPTPTTTPSPSLPSSPLPTLTLNPPTTPSVLSTATADPISTPAITPPPLPENTPPDLSKIFPSVILIISGMLCLIGSLVLMILKLRKN